MGIGEAALLRRSFFCEFVACCALVSCAGGLVPVIAEAGEASGSPRDIARRMIYSSLDIASQSAFFSAGARFALGRGIDRTGWIFSAGLGRGRYRYATDNVPEGTVVGTIDAGDLAIGRQWITPGYGGAVLLGLAFESQRLRPRDPGNAASPDRFGLRIQAEGWAKPSTAVLIAASANFSTINRSYGLFLKVGHRLSGSLRLGPSLAMIGNRDYDELRAGILVDGISFRRMTFGFGGGIALFDDGRNGTFAGLTAYRKF